MARVLSIAVPGLVHLPASNLLGAPECPPLRRASGAVRSAFASCASATSLAVVGSVFLATVARRRRTSTRRQGRTNSSVIASASARQVDVTMIIDMMCPWSFIGLRSLRLAKETFADRLAVNVNLVPFEYDPPGKYPPEGTPWTEYCRCFGPAKAQFLLEEKLPAAFGIGKTLGINFSIDRRIVHTVEVNTAIELAQRHGVAEAFAEVMLARHFEHCEDPNKAQVLRQELLDLGVPIAEIDAALSDPQRAQRNTERTEEARHHLRGGVPSFSAHCGNGPDICDSISGSPTSPAYFEKIFSSCLC